MTQTTQFSVTFPSRTAQPVLVVQRPSGSSANLQLSEPSYSAGSAVFTFTPDVSGQYGVYIGGSSQSVQGVAATPLQVTFGLSTWSHGPPTSAKIQSAPGGSALRGSPLTLVGITATATFQFTPDVGGIFVFQDSAGNTLASLEPLPTALTRKVTSTTGNHSATLNIHVLGGVVVEFGVTRDPNTNAVTNRAPNATPGLSAPSDATAGFAVQDSTTTAAVAALIGMNAATIGSTGLPDVTSAFSAACVTPPAVSTEDTATPALVAAGWVKQ